MLEKIIVPLTLIFVVILVSLTGLSLFVDVPSPLNIANNSSYSRLTDISELKAENLVGVNGLSLSSGGKINLKKDPQPFVDVLESNDDLGFYIEDETLKIGLKNSFRPFFGGINNNAFVVNLGLSEVNSLRVSGSGEINIDSLETNELDIRISGSGDMNITNITATEINSRISGSGKINIDGQANSSESRISGSGEYNGQDLMVDTATARISGSGEIRVYPVTNLDVDVSGSGEVEYRGNPVIDQDISGSGVVRQYRD